MSNVDALASALSGASGALIARFFAYPIEMRRTIAAAKGARAVDKLSFSDHYIGCKETCFDSFVYFGCNYGLYAILERAYRARFARGLPATAALPALSALLIGMLSDAITLIVDTPIETVCMRLAAAQGKESVAGILQSVYDKLGFWGYWDGMRATLSYSPLRQAVCFVVYDRLKLARLAATRAADVSPFEAFSFGAAGEAVATCFIYPLFYARIKMATRDSGGDSGGSEKDAGLLSLIYREVAEHGVLRVYSGLLEEVVASAGKGAIRYLIKESLQKFWVAILLSLRVA